MSGLNGKWDITIKTYMGDQSSSVKLQADGDDLTGTVTDVGSGNSADIFDGKIDGNNFSYKVTLKIPVGELTFEMIGELVDGELKGKSVNPMGEFEFTGVKA